MPNLFLEHAIEIGAPASRVWKALVQPDWKVDDTVEGKGKILKLEPEKLLKHSTLRVSEGLSIMTSVVTYELRSHKDTTTLLARESFAEAQNDIAFREASERWEAKLAELKTALER